MAIGDRVFSPSQFDRSLALSRPPARPASPAVQGSPPAGRAATPAPPTEAPLASLEARVKDSLSLSGLPATAAAGVSQLDEALQSLRRLTDSGPNASLTSVLQRFQSETLPRNLADLQTSETALQTRLEGLAPNAPEREPLALQLQGVSSVLALYRQAEALLAGAPLLNPAPAIPDPAGAEPLTAPLQAPAAVTAAASAPATTTAVTPAPEGGPPDLSALAADGVIPPHRGRDSRSLDAFLKDLNSPETVFNQRKEVLTGHLQALGAELQSLRVAGGPPAEIARLERSQTLLQRLADLHGGIGELDHAGSRGIDADAQTLTEKLRLASEALAASAEDISPEAFSGLQDQLSDLSTVSNAFLQLPAGERPFNNLGAFLNLTYKRLAQIEAGRRVRASEPATIAGALQSYANDKSDFATFIQRFADLRGKIRGGLDSGAARAAALASIPGTSRAFQASFLNLVDAELALEAARQRNLAAQAAIARADAGVTRADSQVAAAQAETARGQAARQAAEGAVGRKDYPQARQANGAAGAAQSAAASSLKAAGSSLDEAAAERARAAAALGSARNLSAEANRRLSQVEAGAFGEQLRQPIGAARGRAAEVSAATAAGAGDLARVDARIAAARSEQSAAVQANHELGTAVTGIEQELARAEAARARQQAQNSGQLSQLDRLLSSNAGKFSIELSAGITVGRSVGKVGVEGSAQLVTSLNGSKELDGSYTLNVKFGGEISAKVKAWIFEVEGKARFEGVSGIRLKTPEQVREFSRLLNQVSSSLGDHGLNSPEAAAARDAFIGFLELTRQTGSVQTYELTASTGSKDGRRGGKGKVSVEELSTHNFNDANRNGRRDPGEALTVERTRGVSVEASYIRGSQQYGVTGKQVLYDDGRLKSLQVGIIIPGLNVTRDLLKDVKPVLLQAGLPATALDGPEVEQALRRLRATKGEFKSDEVLSFNIVEKDGKRNISLSVTSRNSVELKGSIPVAAAASLTLGTKASLEYSQVIPLN